MQSAVKIDIMIPENHRVEIDLPKDLPTGPAEVIVLARREKAGGRAPRPLGIDVGKGWVADDFDSPLPDNLLELFEGRP
jgi:hypothetical protein